MGGVDVIYGEQREGEGEGRAKDGLSIRNFLIFVYACLAQPLSKFKSASIIIVYRSATLDIPRCVLVMM